MQSDKTDFLIARHPMTERSRTPDKELSALSPLHDLRHEIRSVLLKHHNLFHKSNFD
jgi:hypothetical protein